MDEHGLSFSRSKQSTIPTGRPKSNVLIISGTLSSSDQKMTFFSPYMPQEIKIIAKKEGLLKYTFQDYSG